MTEAELKAISLLFDAGLDEHVSEGDRKSPLMWLLLQVIELYPSNKIELNNGSTCDIGIETIAYQGVCTELGGGCFKSLRHLWLLPDISPGRPDSLQFTDIDSMIGVLKICKELRIANADIYSEIANVHYRLREIPVRFNDREVRSLSAKLSEFGKVRANNLSFDVYFYDR